MHESHEFPKHLSFSANAKNARRVLHYTSLIYNSLNNINNVYESLNNNESGLIRKGCYV